MLWTYNIVFCNLGKQNFMMYNNYEILHILLIISDFDTLSLILQKCQKMECTVCRMVSLAFVITAKTLLYSGLR